MKRQNVCLDPARRPRASRVAADSAVLSSAARFNAALRFYFFGFYRTPTPI